MNRCNFKTLLLPCLYCSPLVFSTLVVAADWRMTVGGHDFIVEQADSHTFGVGVGFFISHTTDSKILLAGRVNTYFDNDNDELDPDHIPIWFQSDFLAQGLLSRFTQQLVVNWFIGIDDRRNTVSSVEQQQTFMPGLDLSFTHTSYVIGAKASAGYYSLEIDDDVPKTRGYSRSELCNETSAASLAAYIRTGLSNDVDLSLSAQQWHDGDDWLENQYELAVVYNSSRWVSGSRFVVDIVHTEYNLDPYDNMAKGSAGYQPILPWDNDTFVRVYLDFPLSW
ncbi:hypothetical protein MD588_02230 [Photobacterium sp. SDRW27]|uniref:hypothetical protein n=1 Tax=Photobacterium obscurum TaxID=2829490 RepID=UPI002242E426|nr:hypothetical protein [Photobacterium obscurum]MCW8327621.1 hypothetical protein [Photobacterium obscurum]